MFGVIFIIAFFVLLCVVANKFIGPHKGGDDDPVQLGVSLNRDAIVGGSLCDPMDLDFIEF